MQVIRCTDGSQGACAFRGRCGASRAVQAQRVPQPHVGPRRDGWPSKQRRGPGAIAATPAVG
eukprot:355436-Chlamydomonas_euryale.AAC.2